MKNLSIGIIIPTLNAENDLKIILPIISNKKYKILIIDSKSTDSTVDIAKKYNAKVVIENNFNHGATREKARKMINTDIVVFLTQDAYLKDSEQVEKLIKPLQDGTSSIAYGRQNARKGASVFESFPILFNYNDTPSVRSISDVEKYGVYTFFCSNNFGAYLNKDLDIIGGFEPVLTNEDYFACYKLLNIGKKVAYVPNAHVIHSHKFSLGENFRRYFDTGYVRGEKKYIQDLVGHADKRGANLAIKMLKFLLYKNPFLIPYSILELLTKYTGFKIGFYGYGLPKSIKKLLSNQKYYWDSKYY